MPEHLKKDFDPDEQAARKMKQSGSKSSLGSSRNLKSGISRRLSRNQMSQSVARLSKPHETASEYWPENMKAPKRVLSQQQLADSLARLAVHRHQVTEPGEKMPTPGTVQKPSSSCSCSQIVCCTWTTAPGGDLPVPSFVEEDKHLGKG